MNLDTKRVCRGIESAIGYPDGLADDQGAWLGLQLHADKAKSKVFTIHALVADSIRPPQQWIDAVTGVLTRHGIRQNSVAVQQLSTFEDVAKEEARPCSALLGFLAGEPELVTKLRAQPTTLIVAEVSRKERLLLWLLLGEQSTDSDAPPDAGIGP